MALLIPYPEIFSSVGIRRENQTSIAQGIKSRNFGIRVSSSVRDLEKGSVQILNLRGNYEDSVGIFSSEEQQSETAPFPSRKSENEEEERRNYHVNTGYAIRTLREEFPELFHKELSFDIYRDDIVFKDPYNTSAGIENYKSIFWSLRFYGGILFKALWVDIVSVWQPSENMIMVRWIVHGIPRIPWESRSRFDGTSEYKLDKNGKIYEHRVHNIALNGPHKFQVLGVDQMIQTIGCPSIPKPTYFEFSSVSMKNCAITEISGDIKRKSCDFWMLLFECVFCGSVKVCIQALKLDEWTLNPFDKANWGAQTLVHLVPESGSSNLGELYQLKNLSKNTSNIWSKFKMV